MLTACSAVRVPENCRRRKRLCAIFFHHILPALQMLRIRLFGLAKRHLLRTLDDIFYLDFSSQAPSMVPEILINDGP